VGLGLGEALGTEPILSSMRHPPAGASLAPPRPHTHRSLGDGDTQRGDTAAQIRNLNIPAVAACLQRRLPVGLSVGVPDCLLSGSRLTIGQQLMKLG